MKPLKEIMPTQYPKHICAHRGASGLVKFENTLEAFEKAIEVKADSIECDVRKTKDNVIIINHNADIFGMKISEYTYEELNNRCMQEGYHLPTLIEGLQLVKDRIIIDVEIKEVGYEEDIMKECLSVLKPNQFFFRSFYDESLLKMKELKPEVVTTLLLGLQYPKHKLSTRLSEIFPRKRIRKCKCDAISPYHQLLILNYCKRAHRNGVKVYVWTTNTKELMTKVLYEKKADGVITNYPNLAIELVKEKEA